MANTRGYTEYTETPANFTTALNTTVEEVGADVQSIDDRVTTLEGVTGASGSFTTADSKTVTVVDGRITAIV